MTSNFNDYNTIIQARRSKKFRTLDDQVRALTIALGKGDTNVDPAEYQRLSQQRDQQLQAFHQDTAPAKAQIDRTLYHKLDTTLTQKLDQFIAKFPHTKLQNIVLNGATGTGKTYCAQIINDSLRQRGYSVYFTTTFNLIKRMNDNFYGQDPNAMTDMIDCDLLIIDDLGAEPTVKNSDEFLYAVINERYANKKSFIITTNLTKEQILTRYDQRLFGRIYDKNRTAVITFKGKDWRIE